MGHMEFEKADDNTFKDDTAETRLPSLLNNTEEKKNEALSHGSNREEDKQ